MSISTDTVSKRFCALTVVFMGLPASTAMFFLQGLCLCFLIFAGPSVYAKEGSPSRAEGKVWYTYWGGRKILKTYPLKEGALGQLSGEEKAFLSELRANFGETQSQTVAGGVPVFLLDGDGTSFVPTMSLPTGTRVLVSKLKPGHLWTYYGFRLEGEAETSPLRWVAEAYLSQK